MKFVMRITFLLLLAVAYGLAEGAPPMAKPNCRDSCGNVSIPYPFGIGSNCFMHKMYEIVCNENGVAAAAKAFLVLPSFRVEVLEITITDPFNIDDDYPTEPGLIRVKMPITSSNCINKSSVAGSGGVLDISGTPFFFSSSRNKFVSVGCNIKATMAVLDSMVFVGCKTDCNNQKLRGKCQTLVPSDGIQRLNVTSESTTNNMNPCKHAFLAETRWLESNETDPFKDVQYLEYVPVVLEWTIPNSTSIMNLNFTEAFRRNIDLDYTSYGAMCYHCQSGYEGNPYLDMGCQGKLLLLNTFDFPQHFTLHA